MNERIKELLPKPWTFPYPDRELYTKEQLVHLAELIVLECAGIYEAIDNGNLHMGTDDYLEALHKTFRS